MNINSEGSSLYKVFTSLNKTTSINKVQGIKNIPLIKMLPNKSGNHIQARSHTLIENGTKYHTEGTDEKHNYYHERHKTDNYFTQNSTSIYRKESLWTSNHQLQEKTDVLLNLKVPEVLPKYLIKSFPGAEIEFENHECEQHKIYKAIKIIQTIRI